VTATAATANGVLARLHRRVLGPARVGGDTRRVGLAVLAAALVVYFQLRAPGFVSFDNLDSILLNSSSLLILGIAAAALLISGNVDLSLGGILALVSVVVAAVVRDTQNPLLGVAAGLALGVALGVINGLLVTRLTIGPLIVTLGTASIYRGAAFVVTGGGSIYGFPQSFVDFGRLYVLGTPIEVWVGLGFFGLVSFLLMRTIVGVRTFAIGGNPQAATLAGIDVKRHVIALYALSGLASAIVGIMLTAQLASSSPNSGLDIELDTLTAVILGGVGFAGGTGLPAGVFIGVMTIGILDAGMIFIGLENFYQDIAKGAVLLMALASDQLAAARRSRRATRKAIDEDPRHLQRRAGRDGLTRERLAAQRPPGDVVFSCAGLSKRYGPVWAVRDVGFSVRAGEVVCLLGDNGAGKSSVIKMITGVVRPDSGELRGANGTLAIHGPQDARRAGIATVYQDLALCPNLGAAINLVLGDEPRRGRLGWLSLFDFKRSEALAEARLARLGVQLESQFRPVGSLSGGQRQSVAIARVVTGDVGLVILDEPTAALGVTQSGNVLKLIRSLADEGAGVVLITHDVETVLRVADRIVVLHLGEVLHDGGLEDLTPSSLIDLMAGFPVVKPAAIERAAAALPPRPVEA
jgi:ribose/xylose/arabinose/galactoside ABC-type transport system permease subunit/ABC-type multidrug transport system ATPase subunit